MALRIYNSLTKKKETFIPRRKGKVGIYVCGITVYDDCHLGHARSAFVFDLITRYLRYKGYKVKFVKNITDIDDKIIARAVNEVAGHRSPVTGHRSPAAGQNQRQLADIQNKVKEIAERYTKRYRQDMEFLGITPPDIEPKATAHIKDMIKVIRKLIDKGCAYEAAGSVYFDVKGYSDYGRLSKQSLDQMVQGTRAALDEHKRNLLDFALWKKSKPGEPFWHSPWGEGRPGWHIECSVMSMKYLGKSFDIHGGGRDLIFPHHENETAQAECYSKKGFARYWIHNGLLTINGEKMAKSLGNFVSVKGFLAKYSADALKIFFLQTHYSQPADFTWERIEEKQKALYRLTTFLRRVKELEGGGGPFTRTALEKIISPEELYNKIKEARKSFGEAMDDDFNTPVAAAVLFDIVHNCEVILYDRGYRREYLPALTSARETIEELAGVLGLACEGGALSIPEDEIEGNIKLRTKLRAEKKFAEADEVRKKLEEKGIILEDEQGGRTSWRRNV